MCKVHAIRYFEIGDKVLVFTPSIHKGDHKKLTHKWRGPYTILGIINDFTYRVRQLHNHQGADHMVHANRIKPYYGPSPYTVSPFTSFGHNHSISPICQESPSVFIGGEPLICAEHYYKRLPEYCTVIVDPRAD